MHTDASFDLHVGVGCYIQSDVIKMHTSHPAIRLEPTREADIGYPDPNCPSLPHHPPHHHSPQHCPIRARLDTSLRVEPYTAGESGWGGVVAGGKRGGDRGGDRGRGRGEGTTVIYQEPDSMQLFIAAVSRKHCP